VSEQNFAYWLQGFFEVAKPESVSPEQVKIIKNHIALVKKCWEPKIPEKPSDDGPDDIELSFDLPELDDDFNTTTSEGDVILKC
jgi:hypothetical protein